MNTYANPVISIYLHLETDEEFRARVSRELTLRQQSETLQHVGVNLDNYVWSAIRKQRRIVEVVP